MTATTQWAALGTYAQVAVDDHAVSTDAFAIARDVVAKVDATCSRFRADSDLVRASTRCGEWVRVDPLLVQAVDSALTAARCTDGLVDPTLGRQLVALGYDRDLRLVRRGALRALPPGADDAAVPGAASGASTGRPAVRAGAWREVRTDPDGWLKVPAGCALDLGATGKAFAADLVVETIVRRLGCSVVVSLGGDVAAASVEKHQGWQVLVSDTAGGDLDAPGQVVVLSSGGLATSSTRHRRWTHRGEPVHHIVDPRTGRSAAEVVVTATVQAVSCVEANAASTASVILGTQAYGWLAERSLPALLVDADGRTERVAGWPAVHAVAAAC